MMNVERLHALFDENPDENALAFEGRCHDCGCYVEVGVSLAPEGFVIAGGAVFEPEPEKYINKCETCYQKNPRLTNYQKCEVYSRVVGYLRPVAQWNEGKQAEFKDRKMFQTPTS
ncbi:MAG: hypothetical protein JSW39_16820 [Desulfobacterales bacterium]|nr:MAG: hypothetical protein JSW39_16820 [Desulfobacterales bacterium]